MTPAQEPVRRVEEMTVRIPDYGPGLHAGPLTVTTITVKTRCPVCGGPRGKPTPTLRGAYGRTHEIDVWTNACGHVDLNSDVLIEAGVHPPYKDRI
ncbi:hypothetical protein [Actinomadura sp. WMMA1423]|uniref:hypothetical protein n=1 Tax=Actinomadura sp. WMMA1423 TaxID=2591108 RepID=UPI0011466344|nr:hypothetical protein [Actinomadura sp. WMMA1423]